MPRFQYDYTKLKYFCRYGTIFKSELPLINLKDPVASAKLLSALRDWGFTYVTGHDVPFDVIENAYHQNKKFFDLAPRVKRDAKADRSRATKTARGYTNANEEQLDLSPSGKPDIKEVFDVGYIDKSAGGNVRHYLGNNKWPKTEKTNGGRGRRDTTEEMENAITVYASHASRLARTLMSLTFKELECERKLDEIFGPDALQVQRLTRYPPLSVVHQKEAGQIGAGVHSDYGGITILSAKGTGLFILKQNRTSNIVDKGTFSDELEVPNSNEWIEVPSFNGTFIAMAGESLQRLSNGQIYAVKHKVELPESQPRYSLAFFYDPNPVTTVRPMDCTMKNTSPLYNAKIAGHKGVVKMK